MDMTKIKKLSKELAEEARNTTPEELKQQFIDSFGEDKWEEEEVLGVLIHDCDKIAEFLGIEALPICFENIEEDSRLELEYPAHIEINRKFLHDHKECLKSIAHELRHAYQLFMAANPEEEKHYRWKEELYDHFSPLDVKDEDAVMKYNCKEIEIDAYAFTQVILYQEYGLDIKHPNKKYQLIIDAYINKYYK